VAGHKKIQQIFQLIARLRQKGGVDKQSLADDFEVSVRTVERYLELLTDLGFELEKIGPRRYRFVDTGPKAYADLDYLTFSMEEATLLRDALINMPEGNLLRKSILQKLYLLSEMPTLADDVAHNQNTRNLAALRGAIANGYCAILNGYHSANSGSIENRFVEPYQFIDYFRFLVAYEPDKKEVRQFKMERVRSVTVTNLKWKHANNHHKINQDAFNMQGEFAQGIEMRLSLRARNLLIEEYPATQTKVEREGGGYLYKDEVYSLEGIGRFVSGLPAEVSLPRDSPLWPFLRVKWEKFKSRHYLSEDNPNFGP